MGERGDIAGGFEGKGGLTFTGKGVDGEGDLVSRGLAPGYRGRGFRGVRAGGRDTPFKRPSEGPSGPVARPAGKGKG
jgi:hypothetical protein